MSLRSLLDLPIEMGWRNALFANWPVDPDAVDPHLPEPLDVDTFDGQAWLSVVPFTNVAVRPAGLPRWLGMPLPELNLRTYVVHEESSDGSPETAGVYFFSLDADGVLGVTGARLFHHLPYYYADMSFEARGRQTVLRSRRRHPGARPCDFAATYEPTGERFVADPGTLDEFLVRRHRLYTETPGGELRYTQVRHGRWPLYEAVADVRENQVFEANGFATPDGDPRLLYSPGVDVRTSGSRRA